MKKLIPLLKYVLELPKDLLIQVRLFKIELYANFLNQQLTSEYEVNGVITNGLNRFIACTPDGKILTEPIHIFSDHPDKNQSRMYQNSDVVKEYNSAQSRILFYSDYLEDKFLSSIRIDGTVIFWKKKEDTIWTVTPDFLKIEDLIKLKPQLTPTAQKLIGVSPN